MTRIGSKILALLLAAVLFGCEPPETEDQPQEADPTGVDMDANGDDADVEVRVNRPETTSDDGAPLGSPRPTPEFEIPTETPGTQVEPDVTIPDLDLNAPQAGGTQAEDASATENVEIPEIDLDAPSAGPETATEEEEIEAEEKATIPETDPES